METIEYAEIVPDPDDGSNSKSSVRKPLIEQLLSPVMLQRMMTCGGALLVLGFVGWLWSTGVFSNPLVAASTIGLVNLAVMGLGIGLVRRSRYQLAGMGITLLASLALPLNLWFYDAQGLVTLSDGGHLWIPAAICCAIYGYVARTLRNPMFVYTLVAGVVLTGMLFLADQSVNCFWQLLPPVSFLLATGWLSFFAERLFTPGSGDFSRERFGSAFRVAGIVVMCGGFALLAGGQLAARFASQLSLSTIPLIATDSYQKLWAIGLLLGSGCGFTVDRLFGKGSRASTYSAVGVFAWAGLALLDLCSIQLQLPHFAIAAGIYSICAMSLAIVNESEDREQPAPFGGLFVLPFVALPFLGILQYAAQFVVPESHPVFAQHGVLVALQMLVTAAIGYVGWRKLEGLRKSAVAYLILSSLFAVLAAFSLAFHFNLATLDMVAACVLTVPLCYLVAGLAFAKPEQVAHWQEAAVATLWAAMLGLLVTAAEVPLAHRELSVSWISAVIAALMLVSSYRREALITSRLAYLVIAFSVSQLVCWFGGATDYALVLAATLVGIGLTFVGVGLRHWQADATGPAKRLEEPGNLLVFVGAVSGVLLALNRLLAQEATTGLIAVLTTQLVSLAVAGLLTSNNVWRRVFRATGVANVLSVILVVNSSIDAHWLQRAELGALLFGSALLVIGHLAWYREGEQEDEVATTALWCGSLLVALPMACGLLFYRSYEVDSIWNWWFFHEATSIVAALILIGIGLACRIRSTTISGVSLLTVYLLSLILLIQWPGQLKSVSVVMMAGGGAFFLIAVLLSIYRDRLLSVPEDIRAGRGVFRVLRWR